MENRIKVSLQSLISPALIQFFPAVSFRSSDRFHKHKSLNTLSLFGTMPK